MKEIPETRKHRIIVLVVLGVITTIVFTSMASLFFMVLILENFHWLFGATLFIIYLPSICFSVVQIAIDPKHILSASGKLSKKVKFDQTSTIQLYLSVVVNNWLFVFGWPFICIHVIWGTVFFSWASWALAMHGIVSYEPQPGNLWGFVTFYFWYLIDLVPILKIWETLGIKAPIVAKGWTAALPILAFRIFMMLGIFSAVAALWKARHVPYFPESVGAKLAKVASGDRSVEQNRPIS